MAEKVISGGEKLEAYLQDLAAKVSRGSTLRVGFLEGAGKHSRSELPIPAIAAIHEFGAPKVGIPPRPFMRTAVSGHATEWGDALAASLKASDYQAEQALGVVGEVMVADVQQAIFDVQAPALSPVTLMLRKMRSQDANLVVTGRTVGEAAARVAAGESTAGVSTKPLVDTGELSAAVAYEVRAQ